MMHGNAADRAHLALVDDDTHSARMMIRMLLAHGAPSVDWMADADLAETTLRAALGPTGKDAPALVLVDLKSSSEATADFVSRLRSMPGSSELLIAAIAPSLERAHREPLLIAGADAVFQRHADANAYRREAASIVSFWVQHQHLEAVGT
jgi:CheY-like chemotaxis protein